MKKTDIVKIVKDLNAFNERVDEITAEVSYGRVKNCVSRLKRALYEHKDIAALCAPQIGENLRLFVVKTARTENQRFKVFLNPLIIKQEGLHLSREISASIPGKEFIIPRRNSIHVAYQEEDGKINSETYVGAYAEIVQQMIEMLDGITLADYGLDLDDIGGPKVFDKAPKKQKVELIAAYIEYLKSLSKEFAQEIDNSPKLSAFNKHIDFMTDVLSGKITLIPNPEKEIKTDNKKQEADTSMLN